MIRRSDITVQANGTTPRAGVYITVKDASGSLVALFDDAGASLPNPLVSGVDGSFYYNVAAAGTYTEEYRLSLAASPRTIERIRLGADPNRVIVTDFGLAVGTGGDDTNAFQLAHDALPNGGVIEVPTATYLVDVVTISHTHITYDLGPGTVLKRYGNAGTAKRGMFDVRNLPGAYFEIRGGMIDLNGEGCQEIGASERIENVYNSKNTTAFPTIKCIDGPNNSAIYALRSTHISVADTEIANSGENGLTFRNCSDIAARRCNIYNTANCGIEFTITDAALDGGTATMPTRGNYTVEDCQFADIDDFGLNTGNGVAVLFGGAGGQGAIEGTSVTGCTFDRCHRDVHVEFTAGTWLNKFLWDGPQSKNARQGSIGLTGARNGVISNGVILDAGYAPTGALLAQILGTGSAANWPSMNVISQSQDTDNIKLSNVQIIDNRNSKLRVGSDGSIAAGSKVFNSASAAFTSADIGTFIGIANAVAANVALVAQIAAVNTSTQVVLNIKAIATVSGAKYAYGGASREPLRANGVDNFEWTNVTVVSGIHSGLAGEPNAQAVLIDGINSGARGKVAGLRVLAPTTPGAVPAGVRVASLPAGTLDIDPGTNIVTGFDANYVGVDSYKTAISNPSYVTANQNATVSATANTFGGTVTKSPRRNHFEQVTALQIEFDTLNAGGVTGETITAQLTFRRYDGNGPNSLTLTAASNQVQVLTPAQLAALNPDQAWIPQVEIKAKSDKAGSTARARLTMLAREG